MIWKIFYALPKNLYYIDFLFAILHASYIEVNYRAIHSSKISMTKTSPTGFQLYSNRTCIKVHNHIIHMRKFINPLLRTSQ